MKDSLILASVILLVAVAAFFTGRLTERPAKEEVVIVKTDTLVKWDTMRVAYPVPIVERVVDSIYIQVPVVDSLSHGDTATVVLPRTQKEYADSLYHAWVSGYEPQLDSIQLFTPTKYITTIVREPAKKWHIGVSAGYGASLEGLSPYIGIGITYSLFSF